MTNWTGRTLSEDLAKFLQSANWMTWTNIPLGSVQSLGSVQIADVLVIPKSFAHPTVKIYEVKISRGDFFGDINREKYKGYFNSANYVLFAVPQGLIKESELPLDGVGLITRNDSGWHVVKSGKRSDYRLTETLLLKLLMRGYEDHYQNYRSKERRDHEVITYTNLKNAFHQYGVKVAKDITRSSELVETANKLLKEISTLMGTEYEKFPDAVFHLKRDIENLIRQKKYHHLAIEMADFTMNLFEGKEYFTPPVKTLESLLEKAKKDFPE